jgi:steroid 5-alpha reductase family enzyme
MNSYDSLLISGLALALLAIVLWLVSLYRRDVSIVDAFWSLMILLAGVIYFVGETTLSTRATLILLLVILWAVRLSVHIARRNHGQGEDVRYQVIRANNEPNFEYKSLYIVFGLQALLAWLVSLPLLGAIKSESQWHLLDYAALTLWLVGMLFETVADYQLARFKSNPQNQGRVMDRGLWRFSRHPNYFGEFCIWWGFYGFALAAGAWWSVISPLLITVLLLKVSGVALLEKTISKRRPDYQAYCQRTNAFFPWFPKASPASQARKESAI